MEWILLPLVVFAVLMVLLKAKASGESSADNSASLGYRPKGALFTPAERSFLGVLDQVVDINPAAIYI